MILVIICAPNKKTPDMSTVNQRTSSSPSERAQNLLQKDQYQRDLTGCNSALSYASLKAFGGSPYRVCNITDFMHATDKIINLCSKANDTNAVISIYQWVCARLNAEIAILDNYEYENLCRYALDIYCKRTEEYCQSLDGNIIPISRKKLITSQPFYKDGKFY